MNDQIVHYVKFEGKVIISSIGCACGAELRTKRIAIAQQRVRPVTQFNVSYDPRDVNCGNCRRTKLWKEAASR